jgi:glycosyltransferase involved in cell wall biosynthesis
MNILYLCSDAGIPILGRKGASIHVRSLVSAFATAGHAVTVATPLLVGTPDENPAPIDAAILHIPPSRATLTAMEAMRNYASALSVSTNIGSELRRILYNGEIEQELLRCVEACRPDFIYERATVFGTAGAAVAHRTGVPLVVELNAPLGVEQATYRGTSFAALAEAAERYTLSNADLVLPVSTTLRDYVVANGTAPDRVRVMPNGIDPRVFAPGAAPADVRSRWGIGPGPVLGFVGGLRPWHGVRTLPLLVERLSSRYPTLQLVLAGDGPLRAELVAAFAERRIGDRVVFTGPIAHDQVPDLVRAFDVALAPYDQTDHVFYFSPLKLFEYMACGVAVVAAAIGQISDVIRTGTDGLLYAPGSLDELAAACERLLDDRTLRTRLGSTAAAVVRERYTWSRNAAEIVDFVSASRAAQTAA